MIIRKLEELFLQVYNTKPSAPKRSLDLVHASRELIAKYLVYLEPACEERGIDCSPLVDLALRWRRLWKDFEEPSSVLSHVMEHLPEEWVVEQLRLTASRLKQRCQVELERNPPVRKELRRLLAGLREGAERNRPAGRGDRLVIVGRMLIESELRGAFLHERFDELLPLLEDADRDPAAAERSIEWFERQSQLDGAGHLDADGA